MDQFVNAYKDALQRYAQFDGRLGVGGYWRFFAVNLAIAVVLSVLAQISVLFFGLYGIYALAVFIPGIAATVRRLHDTDRSGWMILLGLIPLVGAIILIVFCVQEGTPGDNQYGSPAPAPS